MPQRKLQVFISSTYEDLKAERQLVVEAVLKAGHIPAGMELFTAGSTAQFEVIKRWIDESDVFLVLLGARYGSIEPTSGKSYVECEHDYAETVGKPIIGAVFDDQWIANHDVAAIAHRSEYDAFRNRLKRKMCDILRDGHEISAKIPASIEYVKRTQRTNGWVRSDEDSLRAALNSALNKLPGSQFRVVDAAPRLENTRFGLFDLIQRANSMLVIAAQNHIWYAGDEAKRTRFEQLIEDFLRVPRRKVRVLMNDIEDSEAVAAWSKIQGEAFAVHLRKSTEFFRYLLTKAGPGQPLSGFDVRTAPLVPLSINFVDPDSDDGLCVFTPNAYQPQTIERPVYIVEKSTSREIFSSYWSAYYYWLMEGKSKELR